MFRPARNSNISSQHRHHSRKLKEKLKTVNVAGVLVNVKHAMVEDITLPWGLEVALLTAQTVTKQDAVVLAEDRENKDKAMFLF